MTIRCNLITIILLVLIAVAQYSLWFGKEGLLKSWSRQEELSTWISYNETLLRRNRRLEAEVQNLMRGRQDVLIERARYRLGLVRPGELFYYVYDDKNGRKLQS
ncbi:MULTISPECIES: septum formation initiator family protein [Candidatus Ichthyocystis]|uniref:Cell division protein FtsB n=1 Tax=Candidatus Ichthyocystis hellenicum TaxID=1561003 RepID=A0A0S4M4A3_9BURK|nr:MULTISPECIES: septum formation initiator family protein [Ichthyocystis]CUT16984.1 putative cell division protein FtsB [Candidatus Ichthyocystis hellenicum]